MVFLQFIDSLLQDHDLVHVNANFHFHYHYHVRDHSHVNHHDDLDH